MKEEHVKWLFEKFKESVELDDSFLEGKRYKYIDNGSKVLMVAHLDTVRKSKSCAHIQSDDVNYFFSPVCDDRAGVWIALHVLPALKINCDVLITTDEEMGRSTIDEFIPNKKYHWQVMFDRGYNDVVMYQYEDHDQWMNCVKKYFHTIGMGSYSCIADGGHLGCCGLNIGTYYGAHDINSKVVLEELFTTLRAFHKFYEKYKNVRFKWDQDKYDKENDWDWRHENYGYSYSSTKYDRYSMFDEDELYYEYYGMDKKEYIKQCGSPCREITQMMYDRRYSQPEKEKGGIWQGEYHNHGGQITKVEKVGDVDNQKWRS